MVKTKIQFKHFKKRFEILFKHPFFWILTIIGNGFITIGGSFIWLVEFPGNNSVKFIDCLLLSAGMMTTVGYGSYAPETTLGKLIVLGLMLIGTLFIWLYMAFLVTVLITPEINSIEKEFHEIEKEILDLRNDSKNR